MPPACAAPWRPYGKIRRSRTRRLSDARRIWRRTMARQGDGSLDSRHRKGGAASPQVTRPLVAPLEEEDRGEDGDGEHDQDPLAVPSLEVPGVVQDDRGDREDVEGGQQHILLIPPRRCGQDTGK